MHAEHERVVRQLREEHTKQLAGVQEEKEALKRAALRRTIHLRYQKEEEARSYALELEAGERPSPVCKLPASLMPSAIMCSRSAPLRRQIDQAGEAEVFPGPSRECA